MATLSGNTPTWWDRDIDDSGKVIRADVRAAAHKIWNKALSLTQWRLRDPWHAAELMETSVARLSKSLDKHPNGSPPASVANLLLLEFSGRLKRRAKKTEKLALVGTAADLPEVGQVPQWLEDIQWNEDAKKLEGRLSEKSRTILNLRRKNVDWEFIAKMYGLSVTVVCTAFWREVVQVREELLLTSSSRKHPKH